jgi:class 3 adenylate cyclase/tetratricopeptide (TPR) repeat protein
VARCSACGSENPDGFRFCGSCSAELTADASAEVRKTVTVLFCDLVGSTSLGERTDPEVLRELMAGYHAELRAILERHGGTVEKFVGDAAMAVFGLPQVHEDDALRAVRAAVEIRAAVAVLGLEVRIGVNTGEVVAGTGETLVTGDAVNVAARLEQVAETGEILMGRETERLVRDGVRSDAVESLQLKGKSEPVAAFRVLEVLPDAPAFTRALDAPFVGRQAELGILRQALDRAATGRAPQLCTIVGPPGIGKSRLVRELLAAPGARPRILVGRCLPYGEGITYWPLGEIVRQVGGVDPRERIAELVGGDEATVVADRLAGAIGLGPSGGSPEEIAWAARKLLEALARDHPLVVVVDDIHWAEPMLLDLLEYVFRFAAEVPVLLLCTARPELFELSPSWSNPRPNATVVGLEPLRLEQTFELVDELQEVDVEMRARIVEAAEGNPLFVEQLLAMHAETGGGTLEVPPTLKALLAARLDRLDAAERAVIERGSVEGRLFHRSAVAELLPVPVREAVGAHLMALVRKEFIRPDRAVFLGDDGFRFGHVLVRDAAYESMSKRLRAELHEQFADWLGGKLGERADEYEEILGYHLEQACLYRAELDSAPVALAERAAVKLGSAGRRALDRGDMEAARTLLSRAVALLADDDPMRLELSVDLGDALLESGRLHEAEALLETTVARAADVDDPMLRMRARVGLGAVAVQTRGAADHARIGAELELLVPLFEEANDHRGAADALRLLGKLTSWSGDYRAAASLQERALDHARSIGDERREAAAIRFIVSDALWGPEPVEAALARCRAILARTGNGRVRANCLVRIGGLEGMAGRFDAARRTIAEAHEIMDELGLRHLKAHSTDVAVVVELLAGDPASAEREARAAHALLEEMGDRAFLASEAFLIAQALEAQGRVDEAEAWLASSADVRAADPDADDLILTARIEAARGHFDRAEELVRTALVRGVESPAGYELDASFTLAEILARAGRHEEARDAAQQSLRRLEAKGVVPLVEKAKALLATLPA